MLQKIRQRHSFDGFFFDIFSFQKKLKSVFKLPYKKERPSIRF